MTDHRTKVRLLYLGGPGVPCLYSGPPVQNIFGIGPKVFCNSTKANILCTCTTVRKRESVSSGRLDNWRSLPTASVHCSTREGEIYMESMRSAVKRFFAMFFFVFLIVLNKWPLGLKAPFSGQLDIQWMDGKHII